MDILKSGTRKDDLLIGKENLQKVFILRQMLHKQDNEVEALKLFGPNILLEICIPIIIFDSPIIKSDHYTT